MDIYLNGKDPNYLRSHRRSLNIFDQAQTPTPVAQMQQVCYIVHYKNFLYLKPQYVNIYI